MLLHSVNKHKLKVNAYWARWSDLATFPRMYINTEMFSRAAMKWQQTDHYHKSVIIKKKHSCNILK